MSGEIAETFTRGIEMDASGLSLEVRHQVDVRKSIRLGIGGEFFDLSPDEAWWLAGAMNLAANEATDL